MPQHGACFRTKRAIPVKPDIEFQPEVIRTALCELELVAAQEGLEPPDVSRIVVPTSHIKALSLDSSVVVGMRGAGKSFWTAVLFSPKHRRFVAQSAQLSNLKELEVRVGYAEASSSPDFPSKARLGALLAEGYAPQQIWLAVLVRHALSLVEDNAAVQGLDSILAMVKKDPIAAEAELWIAERRLTEQGVRLLVLFDALDRLADDWETVRGLVRAALEWCLSCRASRSIRLKFFMRPDLEDDPSIWTFADSSKLRQGIVKLAWHPIDLYSVALQYLANHAVAGEHFRTVVENSLGLLFRQDEGTFILPDTLRRDESVARLVVEAIAGPWMGASPKRGYSYTWIPLHLADARGNGSPRSILLALKRAAQWTTEQMPEFGSPLHFQGIQHGVAEASKTRTDEIWEDYPWIKPALEAARGIEVPCHVSDLVDRWKQQSTLALIGSSSGRLPPRRFSSDPLRKGSPDALIDDMIDLAVLYRTDDDRLNMPDIFRMGVGIKRRGGVRPPSR